VDLQGTACRPRKILCLNGDGLLDYCRASSLTSTATHHYNNDNKSKVEYDEETYADSVLHLNINPIENTVNFRYLGSQIVQIIHNEAQLANENQLPSRICEEKNKFASMKNLLQNHEISLHTSIAFLHACVPDRLMFNCQNWVLTAEQCNKINLISL